MTRTPDQRFRKPLLYPSELQGHNPQFLQFIAEISPWRHSLSKRSLSKHSLSKQSLRKHFLRNRSRFGITSPHLHCHPELRPIIIRESRVISGVRDLLFAWDAENVEVLLVSIKFKCVPAHSRSLTPLVLRGVLNNFGRGSG